MPAFQAYLPEARYLAAVFASGFSTNRTARWNAVFVRSGTGSPTWM